MKREPDGQETNWIPTDAARKFELMKLPDVEKVAG